MINKERDTSKAHFSTHFEINGAFHVQVIRNADTENERLEDCGTHKNKIVTQGLNWWGNDTAGFASTWQGLTVGTGNTAPSAADTQLNTPLAFVSDSGNSAFLSANGTAPYTINYTKTYTFGVGAVVGNIAELGVLIDSTPAANGKIFSRALIQVGGSPGTITLTSSDQLVVTYLNQVGLAADQSGSTSLNTDGTITSVGWTMRPYAMVNVNGGNLPSLPIRALTDGFSGFSFITNASAFLSTTNASEPAGAVSVTKGTYTPGSFNVNFTCHVGTGSAATWQLFGIGTTLMAFQFLMASPISKLSTQTADITWNVSWADVS